jgi:hypothetical protein
VDRSILALPLPTALPTFYDVVGCRSLRFGLSRRVMHSMVTVLQPLISDLESRNDEMVPNANGDNLTPITHHTHHFPLSRHGHV